MNFLANPVFGVSGCVHAKLLLPCPILCDPVDCSPLGSSVQGFSRPEYWSGLPRAPPGDFLNPGSNPCLISPALASSFFTASATWIQGFEEPSICWRERTSDLPIRACVSGLKEKLDVFAHDLHLTCPLVSPLCLLPLSWATNCPARPQGLHTVGALDKLTEHMVNQCSMFPAWRHDCVSLHWTGALAFAVL